MARIKNNNNLRRMDKPLYRYGQALYLSLYSKNLFIDVAKRWRGYGGLYLLLIVAISIAPFSVRVIYNLESYFNEKILFPIKQLPLLYIQNGQLEFDKPMPYFIKNKAGEVVVMIDTTGKASQTSTKYPELVLLLTKNKLYFRAPTINFFFDLPLPEGNNAIHVQEFDKNSNEVFDGRAWANSSRVSMLKWFAGLSLYPILMMLMYGLSLGLLLSLAFIGKLFAHIVIQYDLPFKTASRLFMVSSTGTLYLFFTCFVLNITLAGKGIIYLVLLAGYFFYAVICLKQESGKLVRT